MNYIRSFLRVKPTWLWCITPFICYWIQFAKICLEFFFIYINEGMGFPGGSVVKNRPFKQEMWVQPLGQEEPLVKEMATHSSILAWEIPWIEEPGGIESML